MFNYPREPSESFLVQISLIKVDIKDRASLHIIKTFAKMPMDPKTYLSRNLEIEFINDIGTLFMNPSSAVRSSEQESEFTIKRRKEKIKDEERSK